MLYLTDRVILAAVLVLMAVLHILREFYRHDCDVLREEEREAQRRQIMADNAVMDALWRQQLDREQLFRDYCKEVEL